MTSVRGVIVDVDGTLVDSNEAHARAWVEVLAEFGHYVSYDHIRKLIGMGGDKLLPLAIGVEADSAEGAKITRRRQEIFKTRYLPSLHASPAARELLMRMQRQGLALVAASSAKKEELDELLKVCGADDVLDDKISSDDAEHSKPDPDLVHAALLDMKLSPQEVVMLGDTPYDIAAAQQLGVSVIAFRRGGWADADLVGATAIYDDPADLLAHYETSPLATTIEWREDESEAALWTGPSAPAW